MKNPSSYQEMKQKYEAEISRLRSDIDDLIGDDIVKKVAVSVRYKLIKSMEHNYFDLHASRLIDSTINTKQRFDGFFKLITDKQ